MTPYQRDGVIALVGALVVLAAVLVPMLVFVYLPERAAAHRCEHRGGVYVRTWDGHKCLLRKDAP